MIIERRNILELIGKHRSKYNSCVLTCYSLDFSFFEERVLPSLRLANIKNVNVLADGHYLNWAQEATTGKEFKHNKTYNFQPIYEAGVFHPKIMLITGPKHGLLIIGSGNITSSGLSTNDEIWGAFHLDNEENENAPLFGAVWKYLQPYLNTSLGFIPQKIDWMRKQSPWLEELPVFEDWLNLDSLGIHLKFLGNSKQESMFNQLISYVPNQHIEELTLISPYYDKDGQQLKQLKEHFRPTIMRCLVDSNSGLLPTELDDETAAQIHFHNWTDCKKDYEDTYNRLHAKLIHFKLQAEEYLLLGSANATLAAMGTAENSAVNGEAGILLKRPTKRKCWMKELKIYIPDMTIELQNANTYRLSTDSIPKMNYKYRVLYAELRANMLTIYLDKECEDQVHVTVLDRDDVPLACNVEEIIEKTLIVRIDDPDATFKLTLQDDNGRISNYCLIHRLESLLRCNPDPTLEKLDALLEKDFKNGEGITDLLQFVDFNWADEGSNEVKKVSNLGVSITRNTHTTEQIKEYKILQSDEFNKVSAESLIKQNGEFSNSTVKIAEFLSIYSSALLSNEEDYMESEEQKLYEDAEQQGDGAEAKNSTRKRTQGSKEKAAMLKYFNKLNNIFSQRLVNFYTTQAIPEVPKISISIRSLSSILIAIHLIHLKYGKKFTVLSEVHELAVETELKVESYFSSGCIGDSVDSLKGFLMNVLGKFLLISSAGNLHYDFEILNQKLILDQKQLLFKSAWLILNTPWRDSEQVHRDLLLLNSMYFSLGEKMLKDEVLSDLVNTLDNYKSRASYIVPQFQKQLDGFTKELLPYYLDWLRKFTDKERRRQALIYPTSKLEDGNIIFNSKIGFNVIKNVTSDGAGFKLHLSRAGYPLVDDEFSMKQIQLGTKSIIYK